MQFVLLVCMEIFVEGYGWNIINIFYFQLFGMIMVVIVDFRLVFEGNKVEYIVNCIDDIVQFFRLQKRVVVVIMLDNKNLNYKEGIDYKQWNILLKGIFDGKVDQYL